MKDEAKTKEQLIDELVEMRRRIAELEASEAVREQSEEELKQTAEAMQNQTRVLQSILDSMGEGVVVIDEDGKFIVFNPVAEHITGIGETHTSPDEWPEKYGAFLPDTVTPLPADEQPIVQAMRGQEVDQVELFLRNPRVPAGIFVHVTARPLKDEKGDLKGGVAVFHDITKRKRVEQELLLHSKIIENVEEGIYLIRTKDGVIVYTNPKFEQMFGYDTGELIGKPVSTVNAPGKKSPEEIANEIIKSLQEYGTWSGEVHNIKKDGTKFWCHANVSTFDHPLYGEVWISVHEDITERKRAQEKLQESEEKYRQLFSTESDAIMIFDADTKQFVDINDSTLSVYGYSREEFLSLKVTDISAEPGKTDVSIDETIAGKLSRIPLRYHRKKDGTIFPVEISVGSFMLKNRKMICSAIRDITERKKEEEELRESVESTEKRSTQLSTVNEVGKIAMSSLDQDRMLSEVAEAIQKSFEYYDVYIFFLDSPPSEELVLKAHASADGLEIPERYRQSINEGIIGYVARTGEHLLANDVTTEPRHIFVFPEEAKTKSELCVPIKISGNVVGVIDVQSAVLNSFDGIDVASLHTISNQIARAAENSRLYKESIRLNQFNESLIATMPSAILLLDKDLNIILANNAYCQRRDLRREDIEDKNLRQTVPESLLLRPDIESLIQRAAAGEGPFNLTNFRVVRPTPPEGVFNVSITSAKDGGMGKALVVIEDVTDTVEKAYEFSMLRQTGEMMQTIFDLDRLLYAILTYVTAGHALGFNRAFLFLVNEEKHMLEGKMGVGPSSREDAYRIWHEMAQQDLKLEDHLSEYDRIKDKKEEIPLYRISQGLRFPLSNARTVPALSIFEKAPFKITDAFDNPLVDPQLLNALNTPEFICVPLICKDIAIGAIIADNLYSGRPIDDLSVELLTIFANQACLAIENAEIYREIEEKIEELEGAQEKLEEAHDRILRSERLAEIGEISARIAHEIRNPLSTIGGFARSIVKDPTSERTERNAGIIADEVKRLERVISETLDFVRPTEPEKEVEDINSIIEELFPILEHRLKDNSIDFSVQYQPDVPRMLADAGQIKQVILNAVQNSLEAMPKGGRIEIKASQDNPYVKIEITDSGPGIPDGDIGDIFSPFFTTKTYGTGLGLAVCQKIIDDHGGKIDVQSTEGNGMTLTLCLPAVNTEPQDPSPIDSFGDQLEGSD